MAEWENGGEEFVGYFGIMQENFASSSSPEQKGMRRSVLLDGAASKR